MNLLKSIRKFLEKRFNIYLIIFLILIGISSFLLTLKDSQQTTPGVMSVHFFYLPTCPHCADQKPIYYEVRAERTGIEFFEHDASSREGSTLFYKMSVEAGLDTSNLAVPAIFIGKKPLIGVQSKEKILIAIDECLTQCKGEAFDKKTVQELNTGFSDFELPFFGRKDLTKWSIPALAIVLGLIDGFNPCAMWVLVYLIALLIGVKDKKKIWVIVGSFVLASGVLYFLFMAAWINVFLIIGYLRILTIMIGLMALGGGILNLKEYIETKGEMSCKIGDVKSRQKTIKKIDRIISEPLSLIIILSIIGLAFVVNSIEFVCSSAIPAVFTQILAISGLPPLQHYLYIGLYTFFFILDDIVIFGMAAFAAGGRLGEKYGKFCKLFGGVILAVLGLIMLFAPQLLR